MFVAILQKQKGNMMFIYKRDVIQCISGGDNYALTAKKLGYASAQVVYNWPQKIGEGQMKAIILRMKAARIKIPDEWRSK